MIPYSIDGVDLENERLFIHEKDLCELMLNYSYLEAVFYLFLGYIPTAVEVNEFNKILIDLFKIGFYFLEKNNILYVISDCHASY